MFGHGALTAASLLPATVIASTSVPPFFVQIAALLVAAAVIAYLAYRIGLVPIVGFLIAGVVIGPFGVGIVRDRAMVDAAAEIGVVLLLFTIGIEFSLEKLARIQRLIFMGGGLQVGLASVATMLVLLPFGIEWRAGLFTGFLVALSSTAIVLKLLGTRGESNSPHGQVGLGLLIFQDLAIIVMVMLVPALAGRGSGPLDVAIALVKAAAIIAAVLVVARRIMPRVLDAVARACSPEIFLLTVIALCFGTAYLTSLAGVSLSLGAFLAGLLVSESRFSDYALGEILPLQVLFSATFFVSVGMLLDLGFLVSHLPLVLGVIAVVLVVKVATTAASVRALGHPLPVATAAALMLAQVGEFSFVLERTGRPLGLTPAGLGEAGSQTFIAATVVLMVATPFLTAFGARSAQRIERRLAVASHGRPDQEPTEVLTEHAPDIENHVIVAGYGEAARRLTRVLHGSGVPFLVTTLSPGGALEAEADGLPVLRGDATRQRTLALAGIERAKMLVIPDDDPETAHRIARLARSIAPTVRIVVRTRRMAEVGPLAEEGVDVVVAEELEGIITLFREVLKDFQIAPGEIAAHEDTVRRGGYAVLRGAIADGPVVHCELDRHCFDSRTIVIHPGAAAAGRSLAALGLESLGIRATRWRRGGERVEGPPPETALRAGDELVLEGAASAFARTSSWFRSGSGGVAVAEAPAPAVGAAAAPVRAPVAESAFPREAMDEKASLRKGIDTETTIRFVPSVGPEVCAHLDMIHPVRPSARGCEECLRLGDRWVHLRLCLSCGHVGCCDSSPNRHARAHWKAAGHPLMRSIEPGETWGYCFEDETGIG